MFFFSLAQHQDARQGCICDCLPSDALHTDTPLWHEGTDLCLSVMTQLYWEKRLGDKGDAQAITSSDHITSETDSYSTYWTLSCFRHSTDINMLGANHIIDRGC